MPGASLWEWAYVMQRGMPEVLKEHRIPQAWRRKDFWEEGLFFCGHSSSLCVCVSPRESWAGFFCSENILPAPGQSSQSSSVLIAFSLMLAYPVSLLPRAPWSCSEALENTFQPGRYGVNANCCIAALKKCFSEVKEGIFRQLVGTCRQISCSGSSKAD